MLKNLILLSMVFLITACSCAQSTPTPTATWGMHPGYYVYQYDFRPGVNWIVQQYFGLTPLPSVTPTFGPGTPTYTPGSTETPTPTMTCCGSGDYPTPVPTLDPDECLWNALKILGADIAATPSPSIPNNSMLQYAGRDWEIRGPTDQIISYIRGILFYEPEGYGSYPVFAQLTPIPPDFISEAVVWVTSTPVNTNTPVDTPTITNTPTVTPTNTVTPTARPWIDWIVGDDGYSPILNNGTTLNFNVYSGLGYYFLVSTGASSVDIVLKKYDYTPTVTPTPFPYVAGFDTDSGTPRSAIPAYNQPIHGEDGLWVWADDDGLHVGLVPTITPTPTNTNTPTPTETPTNTPTVTETPTITPTPTPCNVVISGAGSADVNGTYNVDGTSGGCIFYTKTDDADFHIVFNVNEWDIWNSRSDTIFYLVSVTGCDYGWSGFTWTADAGDAPAPTSACQ